MVVISRWTWDLAFNVCLPFSFPVYIGGDNVRTESSGILRLNPWHIIMVTKLSGRLTQRIESKRTNVDPGCSDQWLYSTIWGRMTRTGTTTQNKNLYGWSMSRTNTSYNGSETS